MPRVCTICTHAERDAIDRALIESTPKRRIAAQHGLVESAVRRHAEKHLPGVLVLAEAGEVMRAGSLLERARAANAEAWEVLNMAKQAENPGAVLQALDRIAKLLLVEGQFLATEGPEDRYMVMTWEDPEPTPCKKCGYLEP
jgi:predicted Zn-ribbon and HTH transcriptional regulator